jgi:hypothetical protein
MDGTKIMNKFSIILLALSRFIGVLAGLGNLISEKPEYAIAWFLLGVLCTLHIKELKNE